MARSKEYTNDANTVWFKSNKANGSEWLSNFHLAPFVVDNTRFVTVEHCYQAAKYASRQDLAKRIVDARPDSGAEDSAWGLAAKKENTRVKRDFPVVIDEKKMEEVMRFALREKFTQNPQLRAKLLATGTKALHEIRGRSASKWTYDPERVQAGKLTEHDLLGQMLMQIRAELAATA